MRLGRVLHPEVVAALQLVLGSRFGGGVDVHFTEVAVAAPGVVDDVVDVGFLVEEVFQGDGEGSLLVPDGVVGLSVGPELPVEAVFDVLPRLVLAGFSAGGRHFDIGFHNDVVYGGLLGFGRDNNGGRFFFATGGQSYQHAQAGRQT